MAVTELDTTKAETLVGRLFEATVGTIDMLTIYVGDRLGLYRNLADRGSLTYAELAEAAGIHPRYAREWCEQQAATGIVDVDDPSAPADERRFTLSREHAAVLTDPDSPFNFTPMARFAVACGRSMDELLDAFRTGGGVQWGSFGPDAVEAQGDFNRPWLRQVFTKEALPSVADVHDKLASGARVADVACGVGWAGITIAKDYPNTTVVGLDPDDSSIALARRHAAADGVADRTTFEVHDASRPLPGGPFDLVVVIEAIHDVARPVEILSRIRESLADGGSVIVADERTGEAFTAPCEDPLERLLYGAGLLVCLPAGMSEPGSAATGAVMRPDTFRGYAAGAGFSRVEILEQIEHPMLRFYRLHV